MFLQSVGDRLELCFVSSPADGCSPHPLHPHPQPPQPYSQPPNLIPSPTPSPHPMTVKGRATRHIGRVSLFRLGSLKTAVLETCSPWGYMAVFPPLASRLVPVNQSVDARDGQGQGLVGSL